MLLLTLACALLTTGCDLLTRTQAIPDKIQLTLWYWNHSIDDHIIAQVNQHFPHIQLRAIKIGGSFSTKLRTALAGQASIPDIVSLHSDISSFFPDEDQFINLNTLGAASLQSRYLPWKWQQGMAPDGKLIAFPMDIGPTALFYRTDLFQQAGLPTQPTAVMSQLSTWDSYLKAAQQLLIATHGKSFMISSIASLFTQMLGQTGERYFTRSGRYVGDTSQIKQLWGMAVRAHQMHLSAHINNGGTDWNAAISNGTLAAFVGAVWMKHALQDTAADTAGKWRIARTPGGDGNEGGSFLAITKHSKYPREAFQVITWLLSPQHQLHAYLSQDLFPSTPRVFTSPLMNKPEPFFGGEKTTAIFAQAALHVKPGYTSTSYDTVNLIFQRQLTLIDIQNKDPELAWRDAQQQVSRELSY